jgi:hypothetical protein
MCGRCLKEGFSFFDEGVLRQLAAKKKAAKANIVTASVSTNESTTALQSTDAVLLPLDGNVRANELFHDSSSHNASDIRPRSSDRSEDLSHHERVEDAQQRIPSYTNHNGAMVVRAKYQRNKMRVVLRGFSISSVFFLDILTLNDIMWKSKERLIIAVG